VKNLLATFKHLADEKGMLHRYIFTNYAYQDEDVFEGYGRDSAANLRRISEKYDPEGVFQKNVPGGFKLS